MTHSNDPADRRMVKIKLATLAHPVLDEKTSRHDGAVPTYRASFIIDKKGTHFDAIAAAIDAASDAASLDTFQTTDVAYNHTAFKRGEEIGKGSRWQNTIVVSCDTTEPPALMQAAEDPETGRKVARPVEHDDELFYAGAEVFGIVLFTAREGGPDANGKRKRFLNAELKGICHLNDGPRLDRRKTPARRLSADDFDLSA